MSYRPPGVLCRVLNVILPDSDEGTLARTHTPSPGTLAGLSDAGIQVADEEGFVDTSYASLTSSLGNGFCVPLVQRNTEVGNTGLWKKGTDMSSRPAISAGTVIATFNAEGVYESKARGNHAAFFVKYDKQGGVDGIVIYDQYREWPDKEQKAIEELQKNQTKLHASAGDKVAALAESAKKLAEAKKSLEAAYPEVDDKGRRFRRKKPGERFIPFGKGSPSNNASSFSVVIH